MDDERARISTSRCNHQMNVPSFPVTRSQVVYNIRVSNTFFDLFGVSDVPFLQDMWRSVSVVSGEDGIRTTAGMSCLDCRPAISRDRGVSSCSLVQGSCYRPSNEGLGSVLGTSGLMQTRYSARLLLIPMFLSAFLA
jgi:hypothetical protein